MPKGTTDRLEGLLLEGRVGQFMLRADDGGQWRVDADSYVQKLLGRRVKVEEVRSDFDLLAAISVWQM